MMPSVLAFLERLQDEIRDPVSHGAAIEGSIVRLAVIVAMALYTFAVLQTGLVIDDLQREWAAQFLFRYLPLLLAAAAAYWVYMRYWTPRDSVLRVAGCALFDSLAATLALFSGQPFEPLVALFPWIALVYGVRFGATWLSVSSGMSVVCLCGLLYVADGRGLDSVFIWSAILSLLVVSVYSHRLILRMRETQQQLMFMATVDHLTGLPNRRLLHDRLSQAIARMSRTKRGVAVLYFDLDGFKQINDTHGHAIGDELLTEVARCVRARLRATDTFSRIAGDEFVVVAEDLQSCDDAAGIARTILSTVRAIDRLGTHSISISASVGVVFASQWDRDPESLVVAADEAMYEAKHRGKNSIAVVGGKLSRGA